MHYVYVSRSIKDKGFYVGRSENLKERLIEHNKGRVESTKNRRPLRFVYCEMGGGIKDAAHCETYLKTAWGKRYLKHRLKNDT